MQRQSATLGDRGYVIVATGHRQYLEFAVDLALSLREFNTEPVALILGDELRPYASTDYLAPFAHVVSMPDGYPEYLGKFAALKASPFARAMLIDADCLAIGSLAEVWQRAAPLRIAIQGHYVDTERDLDHHGFSTAELIRRFGLGRYFKHNLGLIYARKDDGAALADNCMRLRDASFGGRMTCDEVLVGIAAESSGVERMPKPLPMCWHAHEIVPEETGFQLIHFIGDMRADTLTWLLRNVRRRREQAGLPPDASAILWYRKVTGRDRTIVDPRLRFRL
ncbi:MAG: hypothetical protein KIT16_19160 [Rhodospirillaceae bacterium]|nr:hypothetical protein [Rhodospirillaceae bacterium]